MRVLVFLLFVVVFLMAVPSSYAAVSVPVLTYHYIGGNPNPADTQRDALSVLPDRFDAQMQQLVDLGYTPISLAQLPASLAGNGPPKPVLLTFDDGYIDFYYNAYPILKKYNFHAVSFIPTGLISNKNYYMTWDQVKEIQRSGLVDFEDHTVNHVSLSSMSQAQLEAELRNSKAVIEAQTGVTVIYIAYPYGTSNARVQQAAQKAGFVGGFGTWYGRAGGVSMNMPRIKVSNSTNFRNIL